MSAVLERGLTLALAPSVPFLVSAISTAKASAISAILAASTLAIYTLAWAGVVIFPSIPAPHPLVWYISTICPVALEP